MMILPSKVPGMCIKVILTLADNRLLDNGKLGKESRMVVSKRSVYSGLT